MPHPTFIAQPTLRLPNSKNENSSVSLPLLSLHTLSLAPFPVHPTASTPTTLPSSISSHTAIPFFSPPPAPAPSNTAILWFRADLRLHDHPALTHAVNHTNAGSLLPLFIFDPRHYGKTPFGFEKTGRYRTKFLIDSVNNLRQSLQKLGSDLVVRIGRPEQVLPHLAKQIAATHVFCHTEISKDDTHLDDSLKHTLKRAGVHLHPMWTNTLYHLDDLPFSIDQLPDVYSTYREHVQTKSKIRPPLPVPETMPRIPTIDPGETPSLSQLGLTEPRPDPAAIQSFVGGEAEALKRLSTFVDCASNKSIGYSSSEHRGADFSGRISPWLVLGCISPRKIYADLSEKAPRAKHVPLYFDLVWRDFFRYITVKYNRAKLSNTQPVKPPRVSVPVS